METTLVLLLGALTCIAAQYNAVGVNPMGMNPLGVNALGMNPYQVWGMSNQMINPGLRPATHVGYPWMVNSGGWRTHPAFRMAANEKTPGTNPPSGVINIPKVPASEEILTHMVLTNPNPKPYVDNIADFLLNQEQPKARQAMISPMYLNGMNGVRNTGGMPDDCTPQDVSRWNREIMEWVY